ncbi:MAG: hypothetical protein GY895_16095 [Phycisphaera sp.]|nr:hypothetical protein [Phycisphaera sp.]
MKAEVSAFHLRDGRLEDRRAGRRDALASSTPVEAELTVHRRELEKRCSIDGRDAIERRLIKGFEREDATIG